MAKTNFKKNGNGKKPSAPKMPGEWLYLNKEELPLRKIYELFKEEQTAEYWEAAGVLEISLPESGTLDMEDLEDMRALQYPVLRGIWQPLWQTWFLGSFLI